MAGKKPGSIVQTLAVLVPPERAWRALTSARELGWLLVGRVEMGAEPGARFRWHWGAWEKAAPRRPSGSAWEGTVLDAVPGSTLVLGPEPLTTLTVKGQAGATLVTVAQAVPPQQKAEEFEYGWADFLLRLKTLLETEQLEREILVRALVRATPAQIYRAWLAPKALATAAWPGQSESEGGRALHLAARAG
ncbi:MAG: SRPBCC domain-containing protein [Acidobacteria bacterium]|nr:SRPBCC domain-containing protein [Acidobacteriota bacterium]